MLRVFSVWFSRSEIMRWSQPSSNPWHVANMRIPPSVTHNTDLSEPVKSLSHRAKFYLRIASSFCSSFSLISRFTILETLHHSHHSGPSDLQIFRQAAPNQDKNQSIANHLAALKRKKQSRIGRTACAWPPPITHASRKHHIDGSTIENGIEQTCRWSYWYEEASVSRI
jgi:hypothetical protein